MVKKLLEGKRVLGPIAALSALAVALLCLGLFLMVLNYRGDAKTAQSSADRATATNERVIEAFNTYQGELQSACEQRNEKIRELNEIERADARLQRRVIRLEQTNQFIDDVLRSKRIDVYTDKFAADQKFLATPLPDCGRLAPTPIELAAYTVAR